MRHTGTKWHADVQYVQALVDDKKIIIGVVAAGHSSKYIISREEASANATLMAASLELFEKLHKLVETVGVEDPRCAEALELISSIVGERLK